MNKASEGTNEQLDKEMSVALAPMNENIQIAVPKSIVPDPEWFDRD